MALPEVCQAMLRDLESLRRAKVERGYDWYVSTSWCSDQPVFVLILRKPGAKIGQPIVGALESVLERAVAMVSVESAEC